MYTNATAVSSRYALFILISYDMASRHQPIKHIETLNGGGAQIAQFWCMRGIIVQDIILIMPNTHAQTKKIRFYTF